MPSVTPISLCSLWMAVKGWSAAIARSLRPCVRRESRRCSRSTRSTTIARAAGALEMYQLGFDPVFEISAEHGDGVGDLLDAIVQALPASGASSAAAQSRVKSSVAIVGRPNAGKSSLVNRLLREERMIVERDAGHDSRCGRHACSPGIGARFGSSTPPASGARAASGGADRSRPSACCSRGAPSRPPTSSCSSSMPRRGRPIRTPRSPARPIAWDAASSSRPTSGI